MATVGGGGSWRAEERLGSFLTTASTITGLSEADCRKVLAIWFWCMWPWDEVDEEWCEELHNAGFNTSAEALEALMLLQADLDGTVEPGTGGRGAGLS